MSKKIKEFKIRVGSDDLYENKLDLCPHIQILYMEFGYGNP